MFEMFMGKVKYNSDRTLFAVAEYGREKIISSIIILTEQNIIDHSNYIIVHEIAKCDVRIR